MSDATAVTKDGELAEKSGYGGDADAVFRAEFATLREDADRLMAWKVRKQQKALSDAAHFEATRISFLEKSLATGAAWIMAENVMSTIDFACFSQGGPNTQQRLFARIGYACLISILHPIIAWTLAGSVTKGVTFRHDFLKLLKASMSMIFAWACKDVVNATLLYLDIELLDEVALSISITLVVALAEMTPCYARAKAGIAESGGPADTIAAQYMTTPAHLGLAVGFAWNQVAIYGVSKVQAQVNGKPTLVFGVQMAYFVLCAYGIIRLTATWSYEEKKLDILLRTESQGAGEPDKTQVHEIQAHAKLMEKTTGEVFVSALSFVFGWGLSNTLNAFFFILMCGCASPLSCSYQSNMAFALIITVVSARLVDSLDGLHRKTAFGRSYQSLMVNALSLTVGWSWANYFDRQIVFFTAHEMGHFAKPLSYTILMVLFWVGAGTFYHIILEQCRVWEQQRKEEVAEHPL